MLNSCKPPGTSSGNWHKGLIVLFLSFLMFLCGLLAVWHEYQFIQHADRAKGVVIEQYAGSAHVTVRFTTRQNKIIEYPQNGIVSYEVNQNVDVLYDPANPAHASTTAIGSLWSWSIFFAVMSFGCALFAYLIIRFPKYFG